MRYKMKKIVITASMGLLTILSGAVASKIYHCKDSNGQSIYSDQKCNKSHKLIKTMDNNIGTTSNAISSDKEKTNRKTIYTGNINAAGSRFLHVSIHEETDTYMIFYIEGFYNGTQNSKVQFRVIPNLSWNANFFETSKYGTSKGYSRVALGSKAKDIEKSDILRLEIWQDTKGKPIKILEKKIIPYKKEWKKEQP